MSSPVEIDMRPRGEVNPLITTADTKAGVDSSSENLTHLLNIEMSRRDVLRNAARITATAILSGSGVGVLHDVAAANEGKNIPERDPFVQKMQPSRVSVMPQFIKLRKYGIGLNERDYSLEEVQNQFDRSVAILFGIMHRNKDMAGSPEWNSLLENGIAPDEYSLEDFSKTMANVSAADRSIPITYHKDGKVKKGKFDPLEGLEIGYTEAHGKIVLASAPSLSGSGSQLVGMTPSLTENGGLRLEVFKVILQYPNQDIADSAYTSLAYQAMEALALGYGNQELTEHIYQRKTPSILFPQVVAEMTGRPVNSEDFWAPPGKFIFQTIDNPPVE